MNPSKPTVSQVNDQRIGARIMAAALQAGRQQ
jgi:hypothetical protein